MIWYLLTLVIIGADQATKFWMSQVLPLCRPGYCETIEVLPVFKLILTHNEGAAFSFLSDAGGWQRWFLLTISVVVSGVIAVWLWRVRQQEKVLALALALILGGAVGNLIDRAYHGYVVDFILVHWEQHYFPAFNVADSAISVGAFFLILDMFLPKKTAVTGEHTS